MLPLDVELTQLEKELGDLKVKIKNVKALQRKTSKLLAAISTLVGELPAAEIPNLKSAVLAVFPGDDDNGEIGSPPNPQSPDDGHPITDNQPVPSEPSGSDAEVTPELSLVLIQGGAEPLPVKEVEEAEGDDSWEPEYLDSPEELEDTPSADTFHPAQPEEDPRFLGFICGEQYHSVPLDEPVLLTSLYIENGIAMARTRFGDGVEGTVRLGAKYLLPIQKPTQPPTLATLLGKIAFVFKPVSDSPDTWFVWGDHPITGKPRSWGRVSQRLPGRDEFYHSSQRGRINYFPTRLDAAKDLARIILAEEATHERATADLKKLHGLGA